MTAVQPILYYLLDLPVRAFLTGKFDLHYEDTDNIPRPGPCLVAAKQHSNYDAFLVGLGLWKRGVTARFIMRDLTCLRLFARYPSSCWRGWGRERFCADGRFFWARGRRTGENFWPKRGSASAAKGATWPSKQADRATCSSFRKEPRSRGEMKPFRREFFESVLSLDRNVDILPVGIEYLGGNRVHVRFGVPIAGEGPLETVVSRCFDEVRRLSGL